ncbi:hypothetical protein LEP1GSC161_2359 [Leptospira santarosai str. CBC1416]|uniref:Uncharacterized protein n=1 Tax=Leptospira santarosai str. CBC1416 TaxID=1193059 RepID=M6VW13_9LEPT|nr:hypothetical protein LEP1GSC161_2359 [Leptospira santarosai str. CBC1416]
MQRANRFRSAAFGYLTPDGSFDRGAFGNSVKRSELSISLPMGRSIGARLETQ